MTTEKKVYYCGIDIEKSCMQLREGLIAVGFVLTDGDGNVLEEKCFSTSGHGWRFDWSTMLFWSDYPDILKRINANSAVSPLSPEAIHTWLTNIYTAYGPFGRDYAHEREFRWICDNPAYDIGQVNLYLNRAFPNCKPLAEFGGGYVPTSDPTEQFRALTTAEKAIVQSQLVTPHSHYPTEDARRDVEMYVAIKKVLAARTE